MAKSNRATKARKGRWGITVRLEVEHAKMLATAAEGARRTQRAELARILDLHFTAAPAIHAAPAIPAAPAAAAPFQIRGHLIDTGSRKRANAYPSGSYSEYVWLMFEGEPYEVWKPLAAPQLTIGREYVAVLQPVAMPGNTTEYWLVSAEALAEPNTEG